MSADKVHLFHQVIYNGTDQRIIRNPTEEAWGNLSFVLGNWLITSDAMRYIRPHRDHKTILFSFSQILLFCFYLR